MTSAVKIKLNLFISVILTPSRPPPNAQRSAAGRLSVGVWRLALFNRLKKDQRKNNAKRSPPTAEVISTDERLCVGGGRLKIF
jgi:hypothetical protein